MPIAALLHVAGLVFIAMTFVVFGDTAGKLLILDGTSPMFVAWSRFALGVVLIFPFSRLRRDELRHFLNWKVVLRAVFISAGICSILTALKTEPIADVFGAFFIGPVVSYVLAVMFLGESISRARTMFLMLGFVGVVLVVKPGFGATPGIAFAVLAGCFYGAYLATTRATSGVFRPRFLMISQLIIGAIILAPVGVPTEWPPFTPSAVTLVFIGALGSSVGNLILVYTNSIASATIIAPLVYTQLISATAMGVLVFGEWPDQIALVGLVVIACSGFGTLFAIRQSSR